MRRFLIFLLVLTLPIGLLTGGHKALSALQDQVYLIETVDYGDKAAVEGLQLRLVSRCGNCMTWTTHHICGDPGQTQTDFAFTPEDAETGTPSRRTYFSLFAHTGIGASTSGGKGFQFADTGIDKVLSAVASRAPETGEAYREEVDLKDYLDFYPLSYEAAIFAGDKAIDEFGGDVADPDPELTNSWSSYERWSSLFRFPVEKGSMVGVEITKDMDGAVRHFSFGQMTNVRAEFVTAIGDEGMYFAPVFQNEQEQVLTTGQYPQGYGLYYIPYCYSDKNQVKGTVPRAYYHATFDFDRLTMVAPMSEDSLVVSLEMEQERDLLHMITWEDGTCWYNAVRASDGKVLRQVEVAACTAAELNTKLFPNEKKLLIRGDGWLGLVDTGDEARLDLVCRLPENFRLQMPESILYQDGALYLTALEWQDTGYGFYLASCRQEGLSYCGSWISNLVDAHTSSNSKGYLSPLSIELLGKTK